MWARGDSVKDGGNDCSPARPFRGAFCGWLHSSGEWLILHAGARRPVCVPRAVDALQRCPTGETMRTRKKLRLVSHREAIAFTVAGAIVGLASVASFIIGVVHDRS